MMPNENQLKEFFSSEVFKGIDPENAMAAFKSKFDNGYQFIYEVSSPNEENEYATLGYFSDYKSATAMCKKLPESGLSQITLDEYEKDALKSGGLFWMNIDELGIVHEIRTAINFQEPVFYFPNEKGFGYAEGTFFGENEEDAVETARKRMDQTDKSYHESL
ncbi:hypothetical protein [Dyadobacter sp. 3J3]|uniref:hypothetical protein n=1 Tax=Dyadobacter sp. 3J3 TaxID=2606600 RepID=UPI001359BF0C|nr:hypothetical protein [Dyadobacter sp. 3J3]